MSKFILKDPYPPTPSSFHNRMTNTLSNLEVNDAMKKRHKLGIVLVVALVSALALAGLGYAVSQGDLLNKLFDNIKPSEEAIRLVTPLNLSKTQGGVTFSINEYLLDGSDLYIDWTAHSDIEESLLLTLSPIVRKDDSSLLGEETFMEIGLWEGVMLEDTLSKNASNRDYTAVKTAHFPEESPTEPFDVTLTAFFFRPLVPIVEYTDITTCWETPTLMHTMFDEPYRGRVSFVSQCIRLSSGSFTWGQPDIEDDFQQEWLQNATMDEYISFYKDVIYRRGYAQIVEEIAITFTVNPDVQHIVHTEIEGQTIFEYDDFIIEFTAVDFSAATAHIRYAITAKPHMTDDQRQSFFDSLYLQVSVDEHDLDFMTEYCGMMIMLNSSKTLGDITIKGPAYIPDHIMIIPSRLYGDANNGKTYEMTPIQLKLKKISG